MLGSDSKRHFEWGAVEAGRFEPEPLAAHVPCVLLRVATAQGVKAAPPLGCHLGLARGSEREGGADSDCRSCPGASSGACLPDRA